MHRYSRTSYINTHVHQLQLWLVCIQKSILAVVTGHQVSLSCVRLRKITFVYAADFPIAFSFDWENSYNLF